MRRRGSETATDGRRVAARWAKRGSASAAAAGRLRRPLRTAEGQRKTAARTALTAATAHRGWRRRRSESRRRRRARGQHRRLRPQAALHGGGNRCGRVQAAKRAGATAGFLTGDGDDGNESGDGSGGRTGRQRRREEQHSDRRGSAATYQRRGPKGTATACARRRERRELQRRRGGFTAERDDGNHRRQ